MLHNPFFKFLFSLFLITLLITPASAQEHGTNSGSRKALLIGNSKYKVRSNRLDNPVKDLKAIKKSLKKSGFDVTFEKNLTTKKMEEAVNKFVGDLDSHDVALFFYSGHGMEIKHENYLLGTDFEAQTEVDAKYSAYNLNRLLEQMDGRKGLNIIVIDACRTNDFTKGWNRSSTRRGFVSVDAPTGTYIAFSTKPGAPALDKDPKNSSHSPFASSFLSLLNTPGLSLPDLFVRVRGDLMNRTNNEQVSWSVDMSVGSFYFNGSLKEEPNMLAKVEPRIPTKRESSYCWDRAWCPQKGTDDQFTKCESVSRDGLTCYNPEVKYGLQEGGIPTEHENNNYTEWCKQLGFAGYSGKVEYGTRNVTKPKGNLFWCSIYEEKKPHWCDWQDGNWRSQALDYQNNSDCITSITCSDREESTCWDKTWCSQKGTVEQFTKCESVSRDGLTCYNPEIKYGSLKGGIPTKHENNNYTEWCRQLGFAGYSGKVEYGTRTVTKPKGNLFWCSIYDEEKPHWCDWEDGNWYSQELNYQNNSNCITSITCSDKENFSTCWDRAWCPQKGTDEQFTKCESVSSNGLTCYNPEVKYGSLEGGIPTKHDSNNYTEWCQQLGFSGYSGKVEFGTRTVTSPKGNLFWCSIYDEKKPHWCDWQDGNWRSQVLNTQNNSDCITSITCTE